MAGTVTKLGLSVIADVLFDITPLNVIVPEIFAFCHFGFFLTIGKLLTDRITLAAR